MLSLIFGGCGSYKDRVAPIALPDASNSIEIAGGVRIAAKAFDNPARAQEVWRKGGGVNRSYCHRAGGLSHR